MKTQAVEQGTPESASVESPSSNEIFRSVNPATGETIAEYPACAPLDAENRLDRASAGFEIWKRKPLQDRCEVIESAARGLLARRGELAGLMTAEMGKPIVQAEAEIDKCVWLCRHYQEHATEYLKTESVPTEAEVSAVRFDPLGVVLLIMPWNYPLWQVFRAAVPALLAGNTVVLKHAANVSGCALAIEEIFRDTRVVPDILSTVLVSREHVDMLVSHPAVRAVSLTGSDRAGRAVGAMAGRFLKRTVLELGGADAFIVLEDADVDAAAKAGIQARTQNNGQSCIAAKRFIVVDPVFDRFIEQFNTGFLELRVGDPMDRETDIGPLAREDLRDELHDQVSRTIEAGATCLSGGSPPARPGWFYPPTVLTDVEPGMAGFDEELFGPVASVVRARDEAHAIELANASRFGLGASVWTRSSNRVMQLAEQLDTGAVFLNSMVRSDPRLPFGGVKDSGYGRELGRFGMREFVNVKTVVSEGSESGR